jgi:hypothetical protein
VSLPKAASTPSAGAAAIAKRYAELRHSHGLLAPTTRCRSLARAAPALRTLPAGIVEKRGVRGWPLDDRPLARPIRRRLRKIDARLKDARVPALIATPPPARAFAWVAF